MIARRYPTLCTSYYCGKSGVDCNETCKQWRALQEFKQWKKATNAIEKDPTWSRGLYTAVKGAA